MSYRLTNCEKWTDTWFSELSPHAKLVFVYLYENCDNAGVYEVNKKFMLFYLGLKEDELKGSVTELKRAYKKSKDEKRIWLVNYLKHQKKLPLNRKNAAHKQIIRILEDNFNDPDKFKGVKEMAELIPVAEEKPIKTQNATTPRKRFKKPTVEEVESFMKEKEFKLANAEASRFWNYFHSNGWKVGKNPMKSWKGAVNTWIANWYERNKISKPKSKVDTLQEVHEELDGVDWNAIYGETQSE